MPSFLFFFVRGTLTSSGDDGHHQILDPNGGNVFDRQSDQAHFSFTTENGGEFQFCFNDVTDQSTWLMCPSPCCC